MSSKPSLNDIRKRWREEVCAKAVDIDPDSEYTWEGIWIGFCIGAGRPDLATYSAYMDIGFPEE